MHLYNLGKYANSLGDGMADQNNTEASFAQYDVEFGGEGISTDQRKMNAVRAVSLLLIKPVTCTLHADRFIVLRMDANSTGGDG
jgi:hypothetical protein